MNWLKKIYRVFFPHAWLYLNDGHRYCEDCEREEVFELCWSGWSGMWVEQKAAAGKGEEQK